MNLSPRPTETPGVALTRETLATAAQQWEALSREIRKPSPAPDRATPPAAPVAAATIAAPPRVTLTDDDRRAARMCGFTDEQALANKIAEMNDPEKLAYEQLSPEARQVARASGIPYSRALAYELAGTLTEAERAHCELHGINPTTYAAVKGEDILRRAQRGG